MSCKSVELQPSWSKDGSRKKTLFFGEVDLTVRGDHIKISFSPDDLARHAVIRHAVVSVSSVRMYPCMYAQSGASGAELNLQKVMLKSPDQQEFPVLFVFADFLTVIVLVDDIYHNESICLKT